MDRRDYNTRWYSEFDERTMTATIDDGENEPVQVRCEYKVCSVCGGKGRHVNPNIDRNGLSREDFDEDPDFAEMYMSGVYDVACVECEGNKVVPIPASGTPKAILDQIERRIQDAIEYAQECAAERRMMGDY